MVAHSHHHGHKMYFDESLQEWRYKDDDTLVKDHYQLRPCGHCGSYTTSEGHDGCLGTLPNVMNACCGHGIIKDSYVQFSKYITIRGQRALDWINEVTNAQ